MEIIYKGIGELKPYEKNPRINNNAVDAVAESIKQYGFRVPILIDRNNVIIAGHTRYKAAIKLGMTEIPCITADDLTDEQIRAYRIADNKTAELSDWDYGLLKQELGELEGLFTGFNDAELEALLKPTEAIDLDDGFDDAEDDDERIIYRCPKCGFEFGVEK